MELHRLSDPYSLAGLKEEGHGVWSLGVHDNHYSNVSCISLTSGAHEKSAGSWAPAHI